MGVMMFLQFLDAEKSVEDIFNSFFIMPDGVMMILQFLTLREKCEKVKIERLYLISFEKKGCWQ